MNRKNFTDVQTFPNKATLFGEEITALVAILDEELSWLDKRPNKGTIILDGQRKGKAASCIMKMDLEDGAYRRVFFGLNDLASKQIAAESIDAVLNWPAEAAYSVEAENLQFCEFPSGCYADGYRKVLVLNTTFGRFVMSAQLAREEECREDARKIKFVDYYDESIAVMKGLAVALTRMGKEDKILRQSVKKVSRNATPDEKMMRVEVENLLNFCTLPELRVWKEWRESAAQGGRQLYFE